MRNKVVEARGAAPRDGKGGCRGKSPPPRVGASNRQQRGEGGEGVEGGEGEGEGVCQRARVSAAVIMGDFGMLAGEGGRGDGTGLLAKFQDMGLGQVVGLGMDSGIWREGPDGGPAFPPTCTMGRGRDLGCVDRFVFCLSSRHVESTLNLGSFETATQRHDPDPPSSPGTSMLSLSCLRAPPF